MAKVSATARKTKTAARHHNKKFFHFASMDRSHFAGGFAGAVVSVPLSVLALAAVLHSGTAPKPQIQLTPASDNLACVAPAGTTTGQGKGAGSNSKPKGPSAPSQQAYGKHHKQPGTPFVTKLVGGTFATNTITNENNAPNGKAIAVSTNVITNTNVSEDNNATYQSANSGKVVDAGNLGAGGDVQSGNAANANAATFETYQNN